MPNFKNGPVPSPEYGEEANQFSQVTEFTSDVYVYGKLYANIDAGDVFTEDNITFNDITVRKLFVSGGGTYGGQNIFDCLVAKNKFDVGLGGTVFTAISETDSCDSKSTEGRVGIGSTQPDGLFQVGNNYL